MESAKSPLRPQGPQSISRHSSSARIPSGVGTRRRVSCRGLLGWGLILGCLLGPSGLLAQDDTLRINTGVSEPYVTKDRTGFLDRLVAEAFRRAGKKARINSYAGASARSLQMSDSGQDDGEALRIGGIEKKFQNLVPIPESILDNQFVGYSIKNNFNTDGWASLQPYAVSYILGWQVFDRNVVGVKSVIKAKEPRQMFQLMEKGRVDVVLYERWQGLWWLKNLGIQANLLDPPLVQVKMFMYLHKKHAALAKPVAAALAAMKRDGAYQEIHDQTLGVLVPVKRK